MEKQKLSPTQIAEMHYFDMVSILDESKKRVDDLQKELDNKITPELQAEFDKEYKKFLDLSLSFMILGENNKEH